MKYLYLAAILLLVSLNSSITDGQTPTGDLFGVVTDQNRSIIPGARLELTSEKAFVRETRSDQNGKFEFRDLSYGRYRLTVRKEGFAVFERDIYFDAASDYWELTLAPEAIGGSVTVVMDSAEAAVESTLKLPVSLHETPRSLSVIGSERIREQNFRQVSDFLNYMPGMTQNSYRNGGYHFYSRGYRMSADDTRLDGFVGINVGSNGFGASMFGIEEVVVLRGPASLIYGQTMTPGGLINLVSKRPQQTRFNRIDVRGASYAGNGVSIGERPSFGIDFDSTGAISRDERVLYRALFTAENMNYFSQGTLDRNRYANGSLTFKLDRKGRFLLTPSAQWTRNHRPYGGGIVASPSSSLSATLLPQDDPVGAPINEDDLSPLDVNLFGGRRIEETTWASLDLRGVVTEKFRVNAAYRYVSFDTDIDQFAPQVTSIAQIDQLRYQHTVSRIQVKSATERNYYNVNADAGYEWLDSGWWRNTTQIGFYQRVFRSRATTPRGAIPSPRSPINVYTGQAVSPLVDNFPAIAFGAWGRDKVWNVFVQNRTSLDGGRWNITLGVNYGQNDPATGAVRKSGFIPNAAVVFNLTPELAIYGSYSTSYNPTDPTLEDASGNRREFSPTMGRNLEVGAKYDLLSRRVSLALAIFQNQIDNALVQSDTGVVNRNGNRYYIPAGTRRSRGAELTGEFRIRQDLRVSGGVSYTQAIYKGFPAGTAASSSPIPDSWAEKTPRWSYNLYTRYDRREGYLKGFGAGLGVIWQGKRIGSNGPRTFGSPDPLVLPSFTRVDTALFYRVNRHVDFSLNVENVFDELIFVNAAVGSAIEVAAPRTMSFRTSLNF